MTGRALSVVATGLVTSVGLDARSTCAALRAKLKNPTPTRCMDDDGDWIQAHQVALDAPWRGRARLVEMAVLAAEEALAGVPAADRARVPLLLCVAEPGRPGRAPGLDATLVANVAVRLGLAAADGAALAPGGRTGPVDALAAARARLHDGGADRVLVVGVDSLVDIATLKARLAERRLLTRLHSNGFMPGEAASALLLARATPEHPTWIRGLGTGVEPASIDSGEPLRGDGLARAVRAALADAGREMADHDFRITDLSGEQYYFKEAALALARCLHRRKTESDLWHPAECTGETGAAAAGVVLALAHAAFEKGYAPGPVALCHFADDDGRRAALVVEHVAA